MNLGFNYWFWIMAVLRNNKNKDLSSLLIDKSFYSKLNEVQTFLEIVLWFRHATILGDKGIFCSSCLSNFYPEFLDVENGTWFEQLFLMPLGWLDMWIVSICYSSIKNQIYSFTRFLHLRSSLCTSLFKLNCVIYLSLRGVWNTLGHTWTKKLME